MRNLIIAVKKNQIISGRVFYTATPCVKLPPVFLMKHSYSFVLKSKLIG